MNCEIEVEKPLTEVTAVKDTTGPTYRFTHTSTYNGGTFRAEKLKAAAGIFSDIVNTASGSWPLAIVFKENATGKSYQANIFIERFRTGSGTGNNAQMENIEARIDGGWTFVG